MKSTNLYSDLSAPAVPVSAFIFQVICAVHFHHMTAFIVRGSFCWALLCWLWLLPHQLKMPLYCIINFICFATMPPTGNCTTSALLLHFWDFKKCWLLLPSLCPNWRGFTCLKLLFFLPYNSPAVVRILITGHIISSINYLFGIHWGLHVLVAKGLFNSSGCWLVDVIVVSLLRWFEMESKDLEIFQSSGDLLHFPPHQLGLFSLPCSAFMTFVLWWFFSSLCF